MKTIPRCVPGSRIIMLTCLLAGGAVEGIANSTAADAQLGRPMNGRPVSANDLVGKKICWNNGKIFTFEPNGQLTDERGRHTTWLVTEPGVVKTGSFYAQYEILPDGSFYKHWFHGKSITGHHEFWGTVCR